MLFAQVREDPAIEIFCINELGKNNNNIDVLCICSGGCTVLSILSEKISKLDTIDFNKEQLYLCNLKRAICNYFNHKNKILKFYYGEFNKEQYKIYLGNLDIDPEVKQYWNNNLDYIHFGINRYGKFEELFRQLIKSNFNYKKIFNRENLINIFGQSAVENSNEREFYNHFQNIINTYQKLYLPSENYFYHQILYDKYDENCLPFYFSNLNNIKNNGHKINYICDNFLDYIYSCKINSYDIIHTSNLTDWMNSDIIENMLKQIYIILKINGFVILRRLNGDYNLNNLVGKYFTIINDIPIDKSHFYLEIVVGTKI